MAYDFLNQNSSIIIFIFWSCKIFVKQHWSKGQIRIGKNHAWFQPLVLVSSTLWLNNSIKLSIKIDITCEYDELFEIFTFTNFITREYLFDESRYLYLEMLFGSHSIREVCFFGNSKKNQKVIDYFMEVWVAN